MSEKNQTPPGNRSNDGIDRRELLQRSIMSMSAGALMGEFGKAAAFSGPRKDPVRIDAHAHYFPVEYLDLLESYGGRKMIANLRSLTIASRDSRSLEARFRMMDRAGVDMQVLSLSFLLPYFENESNAVDAARLANDLFAEIVHEHPKRFAAFACTPLPHIDASVTEMHRALDDLGMVGVTATTFVLERSIADPAFDPFFAELNRRKAVLFIHPTGGAGDSKLLQATRLTWPIGAPLEDTIILLQLVQAEFPRRFPDVKIILCHLGGFAPFLMARFDQLRDQYLPNDAAPPSVQSKHFWYDSVNANPSALACACEVCGPDRILLGTDFPYWIDDAYQLGVDYVKKSGLSKKDVVAILGGNALQLLGLKLPQSLKPRGGRHGI
jgi:predicted TIM-barrel fold metal-dependent hydrolase